MKLSIAYTNYQQVLNMPGCNPHTFTNQDYYDRYSRET